MTCPSMQYSNVSRWCGVGATNPTSLLSKPAVAATATQTLPFLVPRVQPDIPSMPPWPHSLADFSVVSMQTPLTPLLPAHQFLVAAIDLLCWRCRRSTRIRIFPFQGAYHQRTLKCVKMSSIPPFVPASNRFMLEDCLPNYTLFN